GNTNIRNNHYFKRHIVAFLAYIFFRNKLVKKMIKCTKIEIIKRMMAMPKTVSELLLTRFNSLG
ncbi:hypothetical protein, partial [Polaribacter sp.]|uniref:hypothetical protein n=1 Tax=Polaribacter sp. TaxID=1920175 RepID=UPI003F6D0C41